MQFYVYSLLTSSWCSLKMYILQLIDQNIAHMSWMHNFLFLCTLIYDKILKFDTNIDLWPSEITEWI